MNILILSIALDRKNLTISKQKYKTMKTIIGFLIALFAFITAFGMAAGGGHGLGEMIANINFGAAAALVHITELISIGGILIGGLIISFGVGDLRTMIIGCFSNSDSSKGDEELRTNILICQAAAKLSIFAGMISTIAGIIVVMMFKIGGDTTVVGQGIATALGGALIGIMLAGLFSAIKFRFLRQIKSKE